MKPSVEGDRRKATPACSVSRRRALVVEDDPACQKLVQEVLRCDGVETHLASSLAAMDEALARRPFEVIFLDVQLGDGNGIDRLPQLTMDFPRTRVVVMTSHASIEMAVRAIQAGASDFLNKPFQPVDVHLKLKALFAGKDLEAASGMSQHADDWLVTGLVGESLAIRRVAEQILRMKDVGSTVLIYGESGTGKELVARALHDLSHRSSKAFAAVNCAAIPEALLEAELFGARKGAFTDAKTDRKGLFELCSDGTLFLDEIGEMPLAMQAKLLRVLQEKEVTPLGANRSIKVNTRIIAATNLRLEDRVADGCFREDLYYRLSVLQIAIPPLRERREDIPILARFFVRKIAARLGQSIEPPTQELLARLASYSWPGNVRELQNVLERAIVLSRDGRLHVEDIAQGGGSGLRGHPPAVDFNAPLTFGTLTEAKEKYEEYYLREVLKVTHGHVAQAAKVAGRVRTDMYRLFEKYRLDPAAYKP